MMGRIADTGSASYATKGSGKMAGALPGIRVENRILDRNGIAPCIEGGRSARIIECWCPFIPKFANECAAQ